MAVCFIGTSVVPPQSVYAQSIPGAVVNLPAVGTMVAQTPAYNPLIVRGITIHPDKPFEFDFIVHPGDETLNRSELAQRSKKLIKYFMAALTVPENEMWVNLSPYEENRIIPQSFSQTEMGRDLLAQDYLLKQLTASLMYPEDELGDKFWQRVRQRAQSEFGTSDIPMNTFNKVWIVPERATVYENNQSVFVVDSHLKVMLEEDYQALAHNSLELSPKQHGDVVSGLSSDIVKEILIPEIEKEVNSGQTFANLRQIYNSVILATWYKRNLKKSLLAQVYVDQYKTQGIEIADPDIHQKIYQQYLNAYKKGVYNYIKEDYDPATQTTIPRQYFSGGIGFTDDIQQIQTIDAELQAEFDQAMVVEARLDPYEDSAMASTNTFESHLERQLEQVRAQWKRQDQAYVTQGRLSNQQLFDQIIQRMPSHPDIIARIDHILEAYTEAGELVTASEARNNLASDLQALDADLQKIWRTSGGKDLRRELVDRGVTEGLILKNRQDILSQIFLYVISDINYSDAPIDADELAHRIKAIYYESIYNILSLMSLRIWSADDAPPQLAELQTQLNALNSLGTTFVELATTLPAIATASFVPESEENKDIGLRSYEDLLLSGYLLDADQQREYASIFVKANASHLAYQRFRGDFSTAQRQGRNYIDYILMVIGLNMILEDGYDQLSWDQRAPIAEAVLLSLQAAPEFFVETDGEDGLMNLFEEYTGNRYHLDIEHLFASIKQNARQLTKDFERLLATSNVASPMVNLTYFGDQFLEDAIALSEITQYAEFVANNYVPSYEASLRFANSTGVILALRTLYDRRDRSGVSNYLNAQRKSNAAELLSLFKTKFGVNGDAVDREDDTSQSLEDAAILSDMMRVIEDLLSQEQQTVIQTIQHDDEPQGYDTTYLNIVDQQLPQIFANVRSIATLNQERLTIEFLQQDILPQLESIIDALGINGTAVFVERKHGSVHAQALLQQVGELHDSIERLVSAQSISLTQVIQNNPEQFARGLTVQGLISETKRLIRQEDNSANRKMRMDTEPQGFDLKYLAIIDRKLPELFEKIGSAAKANQKSIQVGLIQQQIIPELEAIQTQLIDEGVAQLVKQKHGAAAARPLGLKVQRFVKFLRILVNEHQVAFDSVTEDLAMMSWHTAQQQAIQFLQGPNAIRLQEISEYDIALVRRHTERLIYQLYNSLDNYQVAGTTHQRDEIIGATTDINDVTDRDALDKFTRLVILQVKVSAEKYAHYSKLNDRELANAMRRQRLSRNVDPFEYVKLTDLNRFYYRKKNLSPKQRKFAIDMLVDIYWRDVRAKKGGELNLDLLPATARRIINNTLNPVAAGYPAKASAVGMQDFRRFMQVGMSDERVSQRVRDIVRERLVERWDVRFPISEYRQVYSDQWSQSLVQKWVDDSFNYIERIAQAINSNDPFDAQEVDSAVLADREARIAVIDPTDASQTSFFEAVEMMQLSEGDRAVNVGPALFYHEPIVFAQRGVRVMVVQPQHYSVFIDQNDRLRESIQKQARRILASGADVDVDELIHIEPTTIQEADIPTDSVQAVTLSAVVSLNQSQTQQIFTKITDILVEGGYIYLGGINPEETEFETRAFEQFLKQNKYKFDIMRRFVAQDDGQEVAYTLYQITRKPWQQPIDTAMAAPWYGEDLGRAIEVLRPYMREYVREYFATELEVRITDGVINDILGIVLSNDRGGDTVSNTRVRQMLEAFLAQQLTAEISEIKKSVYDLWRDIKQLMSDGPDMLTRLAVGQRPEAIEIFEWMRKETDFYDIERKVRRAGVDSAVNESINASVERGYGNDYSLEQIQQIYGALDIQPGEQILEIGPGITLLSMVAAVMGADVVVVEPALKYSQRLKLLASKLEPAIQAAGGSYTIVADKIQGAQRDISANRFDQIWALNVFNDQGVKDLREDELFRILEAAGMLKDFKDSVEFGVHGDQEVAEITNILVGLLKAGRSKLFVNLVEREKRRLPEENIVIQAFADAGYVIERAERVLYQQVQDLGYELNVDAFVYRLSDSAMLSFSETFRHETPAVLDFLGIKSVNQISTYAQEVIETDGDARVVRHHVTLKIQSPPIEFYTKENYEEVEPFYVNQMMMADRTPQGIGISINGKDFILQKKASGESVADLQIHSLKKLRSVTRELGRAIGEMHAMGILHNDIARVHKHVFVGAADRVHIIDFGHARSREFAESDRLYGWERDNTLHHFLKLLQIRLAASADNFSELLPKLMTGEQGSYFNAGIEAELKEMYAEGYMSAIRQDLAMASQRRSMLRRLDTVTGNFYDAVELMDKVRNDRSNRNLGRDHIATKQLKKAEQSLQSVLRDLRKSKIRFSDKAMASRWYGNDMEEAVRTLDPFAEYILRDLLPSPIARESVDRIIVTLLSVLFLADNFDGGELWGSDVGVDMMVMEAIVFETDFDKEKALDIASKFRKRMQSLMANEPSLQAKQQMGIQLDAWAVLSGLHREVDFDQIESDMRARGAYRDVANTHRYGKDLGHHSTNHIFELLKVGSEEKILEVGPGTNLLTMVAAVMGADVVVVEPSRENADRLQAIYESVFEHIKESDGSFTILRGRIEDADIQSQLDGYVFDQVWALNVFNSEAMKNQVTKNSYAIGDGFHEIDIFDQFPVEYGIYGQERMVEVAKILVSKLDKSKGKLLMNIVDDVKLETEEDNAAINVFKNAGFKVAEVYQVPLMGGRDVNGDSRFSLGVAYFFSHVRIDQAMTSFRQSFENQVEEVLEFLDLTPDAQVLEYSNEVVPTDHHAVVVLHRIVIDGRDSPIEFYTKENFEGNEPKFLEQAHELGYAPESQVIKVKGGDVILQRKAPGQSLRTLAIRDVATLEAIVQELGRALGELHSIGIVHNDLKRLDHHLYVSYERGGVEINFIDFGEATPPVFANFESIIELEYRQTFDRLLQILHQRLLDEDDPLIHGLVELLMYRQGEFISASVEQRLQRVFAQNYALSMGDMETEMVFDEAMLGVGGILARRQIKRLEHDDINVRKRAIQILARSKHKLAKEITALAATLRDRIPVGKEYLIEDMVAQHLMEAKQIADQGYDFDVEYIPSRTIRRAKIVEAGREIVGYTGGANFDYPHVEAYSVDELGNKYIKDTHTPESPYYEPPYAVGEYVSAYGTIPEGIRVLKGRKNVTTNSTTDPAMAADNPGGIDLNPDRIELERTGQLIELDAPQLSPAQIQDMNIQGFQPVILNIYPVMNVPLLLGISEGIGEESNQMGQNGSNEPTPTNNSQFARESQQLSYIKKEH